MFFYKNQIELPEVNEKLKDVTSDIARKRLLIIFEYSK